MDFKIYTKVADFKTNQAKYHKYMQDNVQGYNADCWAKENISKHHADSKWSLPIPTGHSDTGVKLTADWKNPLL